MVSARPVWCILAACLVVPQASFAEEVSPAASNERGPSFFALCMDTHDSQKRTLEEQAALLKELGYDGAGHLWLDGLAERIQTLDAHGLKLFQVYLRVNIKPNAEPYDPRLRESLALLKDRDVMLALLISGGAPSDPAGDARAVELVQEVADLAAKAGVRVALYPHSGDWLERVEDAVRVVQKADRPNVGVMFNLCHWLKVDDEKNLTPLLTAAMPHLFAVSIHGADRATEIRAGTGNWIQPLDSGTFDVGALLKTLDGLGYKGPIGLQCYGIPGDARDHLTRSMAAWRRFTSQTSGKDLP
ncbi:MAG: sugar phosphate isomerase/epimerase family protein [Candidatus Hydrogenedentales bacterium]|jgi:sugar phosphate isomerase/epimerase